MGAGTFARSHTFVAGEVLTAVLQNGIETNIINNFNFAGLDDYSATLAEMKVVTDPYPAQVASLATDGKGELERIRYMLAQISGEAFYYIDPQISLKNLAIQTTIQVFTATGTWTKPANCRQIKVTLVAGGGGGAAGDNQANGAAGSGGGGGGTAIKFIDVTAISSVAVTVGTGGAGGSAAPTASGVIGIATSWGSVFSANPGNGGVWGGATGGDRGNGVSGDINIMGKSGQAIYTQAIDANTRGGYGGSSFMGGGGRGRLGTGETGGNYGAGGAGGGGGTTNYGLGGNGAAGVCIVEEYY